MRWWVWLGVAGLFLSLSLYFYIIRFNVWLLIETYLHHQKKERKGGERWCFCMCLCVFDDWMYVTGGVALVGVRGWCPVGVYNL